MEVVAAEGWEVAYSYFVVMVIEFDTRTVALVLAVIAFSEDAVVIHFVNAPQTYLLKLKPLTSDLRTLLILFPPAIEFLPCNRHSLYRLT